MTQPVSTAPATVALFDACPFFEKALAYGVAHGIIDQAKLDAICTDAPKGMVQIARYFGNENLRPDLEKAKDRIVNLVSLTLEHSSGGDLHQAALSLRDHSFMSRSKAASDMLKSLLAMPQNTHFGMNEAGGFNDTQIPHLAKWTLRSLADYQLELSKRSQVERVIQAAIWFANELGLDADELEEAGKDAEAVIRTGLLMMATRRTDMPDWVAFDKAISALRKKYGSDQEAFQPALPKQLPPEFKAIVETIRASILADLPKMLDASLPTRRLFDQTPAFMGRYFWLEDGLSEVDHFDRTASEAWNKATGGHNDEGSLMTLFLSVAAASTPKTLLTEKGAAALVRKIRKSGLKPELATQFINEHAPAVHQDAYLRMWDDFVEESANTLTSDFDYELKDAINLLRLECNVS
ncbi:hypothetical protein [Rhodoferax sp. PAMC 29310]|uniref:hypothetical protein n=1 Tax=Rhodoferax sp. PAMC 29310 TaxID=2822760 RepID=UPI001B3437D6|nr:hypothetical protein [Rhodoferax sp. PAMC 29310]